MAMTKIPIPFNLEPEELDIDTAAMGVEADEAMSTIVDHIPWMSDELPRIMTAAVVLFHNRRCTFGEALATAIIWERG